MKTSISLLFVLACASLSAQTTTYTSPTFTSSTAVTVPGTDHNLDCAGIAVQLYDNGGALQNKSTYTYSIDGSSYDVSISIASALTGYAKVIGCYGSDTTASTDFQVTASSNVLTACGSCTSGSFALRTDSNSGRHYVGISAKTLTVPTGFFAPVPGTAYVWLDPYTQRVFYGTTTLCGSCTVSGAYPSLFYPITGYPANAVPLGHAAYGSSGFGSVTDDRPF
jgi:hypothetical protein